MISTESPPSPREGGRGGGSSANASIEARFTLGMSNPLRASVMYPPAREAFSRFRTATTSAAVRSSLSHAVGPLALYAHVPFCETKCAYCDYETVPLAAHDATSIARYAAALCRELDAIAAAIPSSIPVAGFDIGGGTPGTLSAADVSSLLRTVERRFTLAPSFEVSTETTPTLAAVDPAKWRAIRESGVSRVSMGVQTIAPALLSRLNRGIHGADVTRRGMDSLRAAGFAMVNVDLMFALPGLSLESWEATVAHAISLAPDVVTIYDTVYKNRGIATFASRDGFAPSPSDYGAQYDRAFALLSTAGYSARYGSVNFSRVTGRLGTSRYLEGRILDGLDYAGAGLYASSLVRDTWRFGKQRYADWLAHAERCELAAHDLYALPREHVIAKYVLLALSYGYLDGARFERRFGETLTSRFGAELAFLESRVLIERTTDGWELVPGSFGALPGIRALFYPDDALAFLPRTVVSEDRPSTRRQTAPPRSG